MSSTNPIGTPPDPFPLHHGPNRCADPSQMVEEETAAELDKLRSPTI